MNKNGWAKSISFIFLGKKYTASHISKSYHLAKTIRENSNDLPLVFVRLCDMEWINVKEEIEVDHEIDTGTYRIYQPSY